MKELQIPKVFLKRAVGRTKDATESVLTVKNVEELEKENRPTYLLSINGHDKLPKSISNYLKIGRGNGITGPFINSATQTLV
ncbi:MAG: hypothetical protein WDO71_28535 [Bacteroidota bacterium]